jgi:hypothetical protein
MIRGRAILDEAYCRPFPFILHAPPGIKCGSLSKAAEQYGKDIWWFERDGSNMIEVVREHRALLGGRRQTMVPKVQ